MGSRSGSGVRRGRVNGTHVDWTTLEGTPFPLGATWVEQASAWNFALYSKDAESVTLLLYTEADLVNPTFTYRFNYLRNKSGRIWHCRIAEADIRGVRYYAYSVEGPSAQGQSAWHRFESDKILLDPYAKAVCFPPAFDRAAASRPGSNAGKAPLGLLVGAAAEFDWGDDRRLRCSPCASDSARSAGRAVGGSAACCSWPSTPAAPGPARRGRSPPGLPRRERTPFVGTEVALRPGACGQSAAPRDR